MDTAKDIIAAIQTTHGLTDQALASLVESTQPTIWRVRTGDTKDCSASLYMRLFNLREALDKKHGPVNHTVDHDAPNVKPAKLGDALKSESTSAA